MINFIGFIILGIVAGFIASKLVNKTGSGLIIDLILGVVGASVGGFLFRQFGFSSGGGFDLYSLIVAVVGACVVLWVYHLITGNSRTTV